MYIETKVKYDKTGEDGVVRKTSEAYLVEAFSFTEAEARTIKAFEGSKPGSLYVTAVRKSGISEIIGDGCADKWYRVRLDYLYPNERTGKTRRKGVFFLVNADNPRKVLESIERFMAGSVIDYETAQIRLTQIADFLK